MLEYCMYGCFVIQMYVCVLCESCGLLQCCILHEFSLLILVDDMEEAYSRAGLMTAL